MILTEWERTKLSQYVAATALTYAGHHSRGGLFPHEAEDMERWDALFAKLKADGWKIVPAEATTELLADTAKGKQVLAYEKGRFYNAWLEFEQSEGGWIWMDDADSEPNPSHYMSLPPEPTTNTKGVPE